MFNYVQMIKFISPMFKKTVFFTTTRQRAILFIVSIHVFVHQSDSKSEMC